MRGLVSPVATPMAVQAEFHTSLATVRLVSFTFGGPNDDVMYDKDAYWLDMCLSRRPQNARACYSSRWLPHQFRRLGDMFLVPPAERLHAKSDAPCEQSSLICQFHEDAARRWLGGGFIWTDKSLEACLDIPDAHARWLMARLCNEMRRPEALSEALIEAILMQLVIELHRYCVNAAKGPPAGGLAPWRLNLIERRLQVDGQPPSLDQLAALCGISVRQLTRAFRASRGLSIGAYQTRVSIDRAKEMLRGDDCIKSIACKLGFSSPSSFSYAFRCATKQTPREYRQQATQV